MQGIVLNLLEEVVTAAYGQEVWDDLLVVAGVSGAYTSLGTYPDDELARLVGAVAVATGREPDDVVAWFGREALPLVADRWPHGLDGLDAQGAAGSLARTLDGTVVPEPAAPAGVVTRPTEVQRLRRRAERERRARLEAEALAQTAAAELLGANQELRDAAERAGEGLAEALDAGDAERATLSSSLHEGALQTLLAARQDVMEAHEGAVELLPTALEHLDAAVAEVRGLVAWLHPVALDHVGLATALVTTLQAEGRRLGVDVAVDAAEGTRGQHDGVLLSVASDLVTSCAAAAGPGERIDVRLRRDDGRTVLVVGCASDAEPPPRSVERVRAVGGRLQRTEGDEIVVEVPFEARVAGPAGG